MELFAACVSLVFCLAVSRRGSGCVSTISSAAQRRLAAWRFADYRAKLHIYLPANKTTPIHPVLPVFQHHKPALSGFFLYISTEVFRRLRSWNSSIIFREVSMRRVYISGVLQFGLHMRWYRQKQLAAGRGLDELPRIPGGRGTSSGICIQLHNTHYNYIHFPIRCDPCRVLGLSPVDLQPVRIAHIYVIDAVVSGDSSILRRSPTKAGDCHVSVSVLPPRHYTHPGVS